MKSEFALLDVLIPIDGESEDAIFDQVRQILLSEPELIHVTHRGESPLHRAAIYKWPDVMRLLLDHGSQVNAQNLNQETPLHHVVHGTRVSLNRELDALKLLLEFGANPNIKDVYGNTPLHGAGRLLGMKRETSFINILLNFGSDPLLANTWLQTPLHLVSTKEAAELLIKFPIDIDARDEMNRTPLMTVNDGYGDEDLTEFLCMNGANANAVDMMGNTPLHYCCDDWASNDKVIPVLIRFGADPNITNMTGQTPLHKATCCHFYKGIKQLLALGANPNVKDKQDRKPIDMARAGIYCGSDPDYAPMANSTIEKVRSFRARQHKIVQLLTH